MNKLLKLRNKHHKTQKEIANLLQVTLKTYREYEKEKQQISMNCALMLSDYYNVSLDYLLGRTEYTSKGNKYIIKKLALSQQSIDNIKSVMQRSNKDKSAAASHMDIMNYMLSSPQLYDLISALRLYLLKDEYSQLCFINEDEYNGMEIKPLPFNLLTAGKISSDNSYEAITLNTNALIEKSALESLHNMLYELQKQYEKETAAH